MRISIMGIGSRGDIQPSLALAQTLARRGHSIKVITHPCFADLAAGRGFDFMPLATMEGGFAGLKRRKSSIKALRSINEFWDAIDPAKRYYLEWSRQFRDLAAGSDCVIGTVLAAFLAATMGKHWKIPFIQAFFQPMMPTRAFPSIFLSNLPFELPRAYNRISHQAVNQILWSVLRPFARQSLREVWRDDETPWRSPIRPIGDPQRPTLMGFSRYVIPPPDDWDPSVEITGAWFLDRPDGWRPPDGLTAFIEDGPPPVYVGFGSMNVKDPAKIASIVLSAIAKTGSRAVISAGWGGFRPTELPSGVFAVEDVPHDWLFPRMASIVHHGGAGTTAAALRAGRPSVIIPFFADQPYWASRLRDLGVAPAALSYRELNEAALTEAAARCLKDQDMRARAARLGKLIEAENGVERAADVVERIVRSAQPSSVGASISGCSGD
ncbi:MAG: glycosyltransferase [Methylocella sp.]